MNYDEDLDELDRNWPLGKKSRHYGEPLYNDYPHWVYWRK